MKRCRGRLVSSWRDNESRKRGVYRELNDQIAQLERIFRVPTSGKAACVSFRCECGNAACLQEIQLTAHEYERVRADARRSIVAPNHEDPEIEVVVGGDGCHAVVESFAGLASRIAVETDPRRRASMKEAKRLAGRSRAVPPGRDRRWTG
jgi:hypothetical protein